MNRMITFLKEEKLGTMAIVSSLALTYFIYNIFR